MRVTPEKLAANRSNAQKSTGPKTPGGKAASKFNALKSGLLAQTVLVRGQTFSESLPEFNTLCGEYYANLAPKGPLERMLVDQIIQASWRLRRARMAEAGEITLSVDGEPAGKGVHPRQLWAQWTVWGETVWEMEKSATGNEILAMWLGEVRAKVEAEGELTDAAIKLPFCGNPNRMSEQLEEVRRDCSRRADGADATAHRQETKAKLLARIDEHLARLKRQAEGCKQQMQATAEAKQAAAVLPSAGTLDKILRYEAALERQLYRAMNELERLQRRRQGEEAPVPVAVQRPAHA